MNASVPRAILLIWLTVGQSACFSWERVALPQPGPQAVGYVRVVRSDGETLRLARARIEADSLIGRKARLFSTRRVSVPTDSMRSLERRRTEWAKSAGLAVVMVAAAALSPLWAPPMK